jgi:hypothetical protein
MSFSRHGEIYHFDEGAILADHALAHRTDEFPAGYSSAGGSPAVPASASPAAAIIRWSIPYAKIFAANGKLSLILLSQLRGAVPCASPGFPPGFPGFPRRESVRE